MTISILVIISIALSIAIADMSTDIYAVALPKIAEYFQVQNSTVQLTISLNLIGIAISGLIYGPLSDHYGRRKVMLVGMTIFALASIMCSLVQSITYLILMRFIQGFGAGVAVVVGYATIRDMYFGCEYSRVISKLNMIVALAPAVAPIIGGNIISHGYSWRTLFIIISILLILPILLLYFKFEETIDKSENKILIPGNLLKKILKQYMQAFKNYRFLGFATINALSFMWLWAYISNLPFIFIEAMNVPAKYYGYLVTIEVISYMIGSAINTKYVGKIGVSNMLLIGLLLPLISDASLAFLHYRINLTVPIMLFFWVLANIGFALTMSNSITPALDAMQEPGLASAFIRFMQMTFSASGAYIVGCFYNNSVLPNLFLTITCSIIAIIIYILLHGPDFKLKFKKYL